MAEFTLSNFQKIDQPYKLTSTVHFDDQSIYLVFKLMGDLTHLDLGDYTPYKKRVMKLWEKSCFEMFIKDQNSDRYIEFNFSPNFAFNAFYFNHYRSELTEWNKIQYADIKIDILNSIDHFTLMAKIPLKPLEVELSEMNNLRFSTTAVLLNKDGEKNYWAIDHLDHVPNFHLFDSIKYKF